MEENVFYIEEQASSRPPGHGNNCNGHKNAIRAGGNGHWTGDSCGCDSITPTVSINMYIPILLLLVFIYIARAHRKFNK